MKSCSCRHVSFLETEKFFVYCKIVFGIVTGRIEHNVWRICPVRLSKHHRSIPPNVYIEDNCFLESHKKCLRSRQLVRARAMTLSRRIGRICCYLFGGGTQFCQFRSNVYNQYFLPNKGGISSRTLKSMLS